MAGQLAVYVTNALASYDRRRLIEQRVPFIVPGNQLYLPDLGLDLRECFRQRVPVTEAALSPSAQAMLITVLLRQPLQPNWQPPKVAAALGYTPMTLSRAVKELKAAGWRACTRSAARAGCEWNTHRRRCGSMRSLRYERRSSQHGLGGWTWDRRASTQSHRGRERARALFHADRAEVAGVRDEGRRLEG